MTTGDLPVPFEPAPPEFVAHHRPPPPPPDLEPLAEWRRYLIAARRYGWLVSGVTLLGTAAGVGVSLLLSPTYVARATVWIQVPSGHGRDVRDRGPIWQGQLPISSGWMDLLQTNVVLEDVVRQQRLYVTPREPGDSDALATFGIKARVRPAVYRLVVDSAGTTFTLTDKKHLVHLHGTVGDSVGPDLGFAWAPRPGALTPGRTVEFTVIAPYEAAKLLTKRLKMTADVDGNFLRLELGGSDPGQVAAVVNMVAERFVAVAADLKKENLQQLTRILGGQLERARDKLRSAEAGLRRFRVGAVTEYADGAAPVTPNMEFPRDPVFAGLLGMKVNREELRRDQEAIGRILAQGRDSGLAVDALATIGSVQKSTELSQALHDLTAKQAELRTLRARYADANPAVRRVAVQVQDLERRTIPGLAAGLTREMGVREAELAQRVDSAATTLRRIPPLAVEETRMERDVTRGEQAVANLQTLYEEARLAEVSAIPDVRLVDPAVQPEEPTENWRPVLIAFAFLASLGAGVAGAAVLDHTDRRVQYPQQVSGAMGLPILGAVPHFNRNGGSRKPDGVMQVVEAVRGIRLNVLHAHGTGPTVVTVTSPGRSDGKSFVASNLAVAFADAGSRTLLVDGDVRCGRLHRILKLARKPGLTDLLAGQATGEQVLQATAYPALTFLGSGTRTHAGPTLISSAALPRALAALRPGYDVIIVDSSPLAAGADAFALGTATGSMLLVLRTGVSDRELAQAKLDVLHYLPIRVLGAVLNDVRLGGLYRYYSYYLEGYEAKDEPAEAAGQVLGAPE
ncbi:MAG TPA: GNVR domain-containing protein [Gemmatimonadales bacterium]|nr:GNVR domain-containing protein [Gemmatimonadales bacterium]